MKGITFDIYGNIFVIDSTFIAVRMISNTTYTVRTIAGGNGGGSVDGMGTNAKFGEIYGITSTAVLESLAVLNHLSFEQTGIFFNFFALPWIRPSSTNSMPNYTYAISTNSSIS
jgi:hypothetical protein